jgi:hypothetical protein
MSLPLDDRNSATNEFVGPLHVDAENDAERRIQFDLQHAQVLAVHYVPKFLLNADITVSRLLLHRFDLPDLICPP